LQEWYRKMLDKAVVDQVIHSFNDIYKQAKEDRLIHAREIPYFEGDFWPNIMEESIKEVKQEEEDRKQAEANEQAAAEEASRQTRLLKFTPLQSSSEQGQAISEVQKKQKLKKGNKKASKRSTNKKLLTNSSNNLSDKLYGVMEKHREVFFVIRLQSVESVAKIGAINDPDPLVPCELMDGRDSFLTSARENHYEFSSMRRATYSTLCLTYDLHVQSQDFMYTCNNCKANVETRLHCSVCEDFDLCKTCYRQVGHKHKMDQIGLGLDPTPGGNSSSNQRNESVQRVISSLKHASQCKNANCHSVQCKQMKKVLHHAKSCRMLQNQNNNCTVCKRLIILCVYHAKICQENKCVVPFCTNFRMKIRNQEKEHRRRQEQLIARRVAIMTTQCTVDRSSTEAMSSSMVVSKGTGGDIANKAPRTPQQLDQPLTPSQNMTEPGTPGSQHGPGTPNSQQGMVKPGLTSRSPHRRISQQPGALHNVNNIPIQLQSPQILPHGPNKSYVQPYKSASDKAIMSANTPAMMAANQAQAIAASQARPGASAGMQHSVPPSMHHSIISGSNVSSQWSRAPSDPNFMKPTIGSQVVSVNNSPNLPNVRNINPGNRSVVVNSMRGMRKTRPQMSYINRHQPRLRNPVRAQLRVC